jgi:hypothetical protein
MSNINGLTSLAPVYVTGASDSNIWATKIAPTIISPISIVSTDGAKTGTIGVVPSGDMGIYAGAGGTVYMGGSGAVGLASLDSTPTVTVGLNGGRVYDTVYNVPVKYVDGATLTLISPLTKNTVSTDTFVAPRTGVYQVVLGASNAFSDATPAPVLPAGGVLQVWLTGGGAVAPYSVGYSEVTLATSEMATPASTGISTYLTGVIYNKSSGVVTLTAGTTYTINAAFWGSADLVLGGTGNEILIEVVSLS